MYTLEHFDSNWDLITNLQKLNHQDNSTFYEYFITLSGHEWRGKWRSLLEFSHSSKCSRFFHLIFLQQLRSVFLLKLFPNSFSFMFQLSGFKSIGTLPISVFAMHLSSLSVYFILHCNCYIGDVHRRTHSSCITVCLLNYMQCVFRTQRFVSILLRNDRLYLELSLINIHCSRST